VQKLARLVDDLLDVSRITAGRLSLEREEVDLGALVRESAALWEDQARRAGFAVTVACDGDCRGKWDKKRIEQVLGNLLSNAVKYGGDKPVEVAVRSRPAAIEVEVRDHGIGIAPSDRRRIFDRFERAVPSRRYGGLGLGLWIARRIVEAHEGRIRVEHADGGGARFVVELPRA
jgi:signal transduction histidine kinase